MSNDDQKRAETGAMRFGDDWPGVFLRGDNAFAYSMALSTLLDAIEGTAKRSADAGNAVSEKLASLAVISSFLRGLASYLASCDVREKPSIVNNLRPFAECLAIIAPEKQDSGGRATRSMFATWLHDRADDVVNDDPAAAETLYLAERDFRATFRLDSRRAGETLDIDAMESVARSATANVTDDGYRLRAPSIGDECGAVIVDYKSSEHPNADNDGALFGHAREYVLSLVAAVRERDARLASAVERAKRFAKAYEHNAEYCEKRFGEVTGEWAQEYARKAVGYRGVVNDMRFVIRIAEGEEK